MTVANITRTGIFRSALLSLFLGALACATFFTWASNASAATAGESYGYQGDVGSGGVGTVDPIFDSVAVSDDGRIFVIRQFDFNAIGGFEVLEPDGTSIVIKDTGEYWPSAIAVSPDGGAVYTLNAFKPPVKYTSDGAPVPTYTPDPQWTPSIPGSPKDIEVDPVSGEVLVAADGPVLRYDSTSGALLSTIDGPDPENPLSANKIAVAPNRDIYVFNDLTRVEHLGADGSSKGRLDIPDANASVTNQGIAVNPQNGDVAVELSAGVITQNDTVLRIYSAANELKDTIRVPPALAGDNSDLVFSPDGTKLYVGLKDGTAHEFVLGTKPGLDGPTVSQLSPTGFRLTDFVATGGETTNAHFEYCIVSDPCGSYLSSEGSSPWRQVLPDHSGLAHPTENDEIVDDVTGLEPLRDYLVRSYAFNEASGVETISASVSVSTPPSPPDVQTGQATAANTTVKLTGTVNAIGAQTTYHFEYGLTTGYGSRAPAGVDAIAGGLRTPRAVSQTVKGLQPGTTYHYRLVATNAGGTTAGSDRTFTTLGADQVAPNRGYEQVTSPNKNGLALNASWGFAAAPGGGAIEYAAAAPAGEAESAAQASRYIARRGDTNWSGQQALDPPQGRTRAILNSVTAAVSDDFEHSLSVSPIALTPDATEGAANIYVRDLQTGAYRLVGTATQAGAWGGMGGTKRADWYLGGAPDFSWVVLTSRYPLLPGAPQVATYKWTQDDGLSVVSLLPGDTVPTGNTWVQTSENAANRLVSDDGDTVAFSLLSGDSGVYRRSGSQTVPISVSEESGETLPGIAVGMSRNGRFVVFVSAAKLTDDAAETTSQRNIYRYDATSGQLESLGVNDGTGDGTQDVLAISDDGETVYFNRYRVETNSNDEAISVLDLAVWREGQVDAISPTASRDGFGYASPNGRYLSFLQDGAVHLYDAEAGEETCISCPPTGVAAGGQLPDPERNISNRRPQAVTDDGHAFFGTTQALLSADHNSTRDVYEYFDGRLSLISPGNDNFTASFVDISPDGRDVFFTTSQGLVGQDTDQQYDIYDARIGGGLAAQNPPPPPPPCAGDACQGAPNAQPGITTPGSTQSRSSGNPKRVHKGRCGKNARKVQRNGKARCVKKQGKNRDRKRIAKHNRGANR